LLQQLPDNGKQSVQEALRMFGHYSAQIGGTESVLGKPKADGDPYGIKKMNRGFGMSLDQMRKGAMEYFFRQA